MAFIPAQRVNCLCHPHEFSEYNFLPIIFIWECNLHWVKYTDYNALYQRLYWVTSRKYIYSANQWCRDLFKCRIDLLNFSMGFNIVAPYMVCVTHKWISPPLKWKLCVQGFFADIFVNIGHIDTGSSAVIKAYKRLCMMRSYWNINTKLIAQCFHLYCRVEFTSTNTALVAHQRFDG